MIDPEVLISPQIYIETMPDINGFPSELRGRFEYRWEGVVSYLKKQHQDVDKDSWMNRLNDLPYVRESCKFIFSKPAEHIDDAYRAVATQ